jgi:hypothetical protein
MIDGWNEPVDTLLRLQTAVRIIARAKGNPRSRNKLCRATFALTGLLPEHFPERIRGRAPRCSECERASDRIMATTPTASSFTLNG